MRVPGHMHYIYTTYRKKKLHNVTIFLLHAFTAKKYYTNYNIHRKTVQVKHPLFPKGVGLGVCGWRGCCAHRMYSRRPSRTGRRPYLSEPSATALWVRC